MIFNSYIFILLFLPLALAVWRVIGRKMPGQSRVWLLLASLIFYGYASAYYLLLLMGTILVNYAFVRMIRKARSEIRPKGAARLLTGGVAINIALLIYFKYMNFFRDIAGSITGVDIPVFKIMLPLGISFYTFSQIAFLVDSYRGETDDVTFGEYALYISYFPKLIQGPISLWSDLKAEIRRPAPAAYDWDKASRGLGLFSIGLGKKMLIADTLGKAVDLGMLDVHGLYSLDVWAVMIAYSFQIYFDFSGYCDMASGVSLLFGIELPVNFDSPYKALSISDFWKRWHMTLTSFFRKYLYFPLGGSRKGKARTYLNMIIVFLLSGLWHGASMTFVLWGLLHGVFQVLHRIFARIYDRLPAFIRWILTFLTVSSLWLLFRAGSIADWAYMMGKAFRLRYWVMHEEIAMVFRIPRLRTVLSAIGMSYSDMDVYMLCTYAALALCLLLCLIPENSQRRQFKNSPLGLTACLIILTVCILKMSSVTAFLYFNF
ncbi:MBOAT family O-acyltransferase [Butyrivibrio sp. MC2013]|uniref:MBOAT family O-acyltransferase n=1 Tax=Butyrivibrio sp. MC2013 TaxID=1280686 RepID=UPI000421EB0C|nr:MBOAT family O-acyltransferase [Butyrivibrio sp. MC2013]